MTPKMTFILGHFWYFNVDLFRVLVCFEWNWFKNSITCKHFLGLFKFAEKPQIFFFPAKISSLFYYNDIYFLIHFLFLFHFHLQLRIGNGSDIILKQFRDVVGGPAPFSYIYINYLPYQVSCRILINLIRFQRYRRALFF